jgi:hypothetical protein
MTTTKYVFLAKKELFSRFLRHYLGITPGLIWHLPSNAAMKFRQYYALCLLSFGAVGFFAPMLQPSPVMAQTSSRNLEVTRIVGSVTFLNSPTRLKVGDRLTQVGQGITTGARSTALLQLDDAIGAVNVAEQTSFTIRELSTTSNGGKVTILEVKRGQIRVNVRTFSNPQSRLEVRTPAGVAGVRGTDFGVAVGNDGQTNVMTQEGIVGVTGAGETVGVQEGYATIVVEGEAPTEPRPIYENLQVTLASARWDSAKRSWQVMGMTDPFNFVWINEQQVQVAENGSFTLNYPDIPRDVQSVRVLTPLGSTKTIYTFIRNDPFPIQLEGDRPDFIEDQKKFQPFYNKLLCL